MQFTFQNRVKVYIYFMSQKADMLRAELGCDYAENSLKSEKEHLGNFLKVISEERSERF